MLRISDKHLHIVSRHKSPLMADVQQRSYLLVGKLRKVGGGYEGRQQFGEKGREGVGLQE